jgi:hypothetical protein
MNEFMPAPSAEIQDTEHLTGTQPAPESRTERLFPERVSGDVDFLGMLLPQPTTLIYPDLRPYVTSRPARRDSDNILDSLLDRVVHPYNVEALESLLEKHNLSSSYPHLILNLREGFPIGRMPVLTHTIILPNHWTADVERDTTLEYLKTEIDAGRMSGPFTREEMERICRGPFYASPLIVATNDQGPGIPPKKRVCRNLSKADARSGTPAVNDFISKEDFPTRFDMAPAMAELVSRHSDRPIPPRLRWHSLLVSCLSPRPRAVCSLPTGSSRSSLV